MGSSARAREGGWVRSSFHQRAAWQLLTSSSQLTQQEPACSTWHDCTHGALTGTAGLPGRIAGRPCADTMVSGFAPKEKLLWDAALWLVSEGAQQRAALPCCMLVPALLAAGAGLRCGSGGCCSSEDGNSRA